jgi:4-amino-4-deoxy-L-arabinose transferase-like glycosyltransferase
MNPKKITLALLVAFICCGFALRLYRINVVPLRGDEAFTVLNWMRQPLAETLEYVATRDPQPPLAYATYRLYALLVGDGEYQVRFLPALLNVVGISALYALGRRLGGRRLGLLAALLWAINPYQIWHAQDARNYAIWAALSPLALWLALRALERQQLVDWVLYVVFACVTLYFYYLELFIVFALNLYVFLTYWRNRPLLLRWFVSQVGIALVLVPWYLQERLLLGSGYGGTATGFDPLRLVTYFVPSLLFGEGFAYRLLTSDALLFWGVLVLLVNLLVFGIVFLWREDRRKGMLLGLVGTVPLMLLGLVSLKLNVFTPRYVLAVSPVYVLSVGFVLLRLWIVRRRSLVHGGVFFFVSFVVLSLNASSLFAYYLHRDYAKARDWRSLASYFAVWTHSDDLILNTSADEAFTFYHSEYAVPAEQIRLPASGEQSVEEIESILDDSQNQYESIWLAAQTPSDWRTAGIVEAWLAAHMQPVRLTSIDGLRAQQFMRWEVEPIEQTPLATFGQIAELVNAQVFLPPEPTEELTIWLYWRPLGTSPTPLKVFVHLLGEINPATGTPLWAQDDQYPQNGRISTTDWESSMLYRDVFMLPVQSIPSGEYMLTVGLYDPVTNERLTVGEGDNFFLQSVIIPDYAK